MHVTKSTFKIKICSNKPSFYSWGFQLISSLQFICTLKKNNVHLIFLLFSTVLMFYNESHTFSQQEKVHFCEQFCNQIETMSSPLLFSPHLISHNMLTILVKSVNLSQFHILSSFCPLFSNHVIRAQSHYILYFYSSLSSAIIYAYIINYHKSLSQCLFSFGNLHL